MSGKKYYTDSNRVTHLIKKRVRVDENGNVHIIKSSEYNGHNVYSSSHIVKYHIDTNNVVDVEVDDGGNAIAVAPTATKSGYTLVGWREDTTASSSVLSSKTITTDGVHLYAVFKQTITVSLVGGTSTVESTGIKYYNNGNVANPSITIGSATKSGWTLIGYRSDTTATATVTKYAGTAYTFSANTTLYAVFNRTISISYSANGGSGSMSPSSGTQIFNNGNYDNPYITLSQNGFSYTDYSFTDWLVGTYGRFTAGSKVQISDNTMANAGWTYGPSRSFSLASQPISSAWTTIYTSPITFNRIALSISSPFGTGISTSGYKLKLSYGEDDPEAMYFTFSGGGGGYTPIKIDAYCGRCNAGMLIQITNENLSPGNNYFGDINGSIWFNEDEPIL